jgi:hypothetical protein
VPLPDDAVRRVPRIAPGNPARTAVLDLRPSPVTRTVGSIRTVVRPTRDGERAAAPARGPGAADAVHTVADDGRNAAHDVQERVQEAVGSVRDQASG